MKIKILFAVQIFEMSSFFKKQNLGKKTNQNKLMEKKTRKYDLFIQTFSCNFVFARMQNYDEI